MLADSLKTEDVFCVVRSFLRPTSKLSIVGSGDDEQLAAVLMVKIVLKFSIPYTPR
jgi:hypothetical protein